MHVHCPMQNGCYNASMVLIFANGVLDEVEWIRPYLANATAVIAANGGSEHLHRLNHPPDRLIGDADSITPNTAQWLRENEVPFYTSPAEKDETDLELAITYAVDRFEEPILLLGLLGGRLDQLLGNVLLLTHPAFANHSIQIVTHREKAWLVRDETMIYGRPNDLVSLIPLGGDVFVEQMTGLKYPLTHEWLKFGPARGISNVMTHPTASVRLSQGLLLCVHTYQQKS